MSTQFLAPAVVPEEEILEESLRPRSLTEFVGQERIKNQLAIALTAAKARDDPLDHVLLVGPPGLGKTSLAHIVREELGVGIRCVAGPALERKGDMAAILTGLERHDVLFVDEIHRLNRAIEEILYPALEDFRLDIIVGQGAAASACRRSRCRSARSPTRSRTCTSRTSSSSGSCSARPVAA